MFWQGLGGFCLGLGGAILLGILLLIPIFVEQLNKESDPQGWYGRLEGPMRGGIVALVGLPILILAGLAAGVFLAIKSSQTQALWPLLGYPVLGVPVLLGFLLLQRKS